MSPCDKFSLTVISFLFSAFTLANAEFCDEADGDDNAEVKEEETEEIRYMSCR